MIASTVRSTVSPLRGKGKTQFSLPWLLTFYSIMSKGSIFFFTEMAFNDATIVLKMLKHI